MGSVETVDTLIQKLGASSNASELTELLHNLKTALSHYSRAELAEKVVTNDNLVETLFGCLSPNPEHDELVRNSCDILKQLMGIADAGDVLSRYSKDMLEGLQEHPNSEVRLLAIAQLSRCLETDANISILCNNHSQLVHAVIQQLTFTDLSVANKASKFIVSLAQSRDGSEFLGHTSSLAEFQKLIDSTNVRSEKYYRVLEALANLSVVTPELFEKVRSKINLATVLSDVAFGDADPLGSANALEILATLAGTPFGLEAVTQIGVVDKIERLTQELDSNPLSNLLFPEMLKFIGKVGVNQLPPPRLREIVLSTITQPQLEIHVTTVAIEAMTFIGCTKDGKAYLFGKAETLECFKKAREIIGGGQAEYRVRILDAMSILFSTDDNGGQNCLPHWFNYLFPQISALFDLVQQPFPDIRLSALNFLNAVAPLEWAQRHYLRTPGVVEFLTNRDAEPNKECLFAKFKIVSVIADSKSAAKILSPENYGRLKIYKDQGPYYAAATSTVATEGSS